MKLLLNRSQFFPVTTFNVFQQRPAGEPSSDSRQLIRTLQPDVIKCLEEPHDFNTPVEGPMANGHVQRFTGDLCFRLHTHRVRGQIFKNTSYMHLKMQRSIHDLQHQIFTLLCKYYIIYYIHTPLLPYVKHLCFWPLLPRPGTTFQAQSP